MTAAPHPARPEVAFFAAQTARLSHQINNVLSILGELAGLLDDLALAAEARPLPPARLQSLAARMIDNVGRGADLVRLLNRFAHAADEPETEADLGAVAQLFAGLSARPLQLCRGRLELRRPAERVHSRTDPLAVLRLLDAARDALCAAAEGPPALTLEVAALPLGVSLRLVLEGGAEPSRLEPHLEALGAQASELGLDLAVEAGSAAGAVAISLTCPQPRPTAGGSV